MRLALAASFTVVPFIGGLLAGNPYAFRFLALPGGLAVTVVPVIVYFALPESPRWHLRKGHAQAAVDTVNRIIARCGNRVPPLRLAELGDHREVAREQLPPYWALFARGQLRWTTVGVLSGVCAGTAFFLISVLLPKALNDQGFAVNASLALTSIVYAASFLEGFHRVPDGDHRAALDDCVCAYRITAGPCADAPGANASQCALRNGNGRGNGSG